VPSREERAQDRAIFPKAELLSQLGVRSKQLATRFLLQRLDLLGVSSVHARTRAGLGIELHATQAPLPGAHRGAHGGQCAALALQSSPLRHTRAELTAGRRPGLCLVGTPR